MKSVSAAAARLRILLTECAACSAVRLWIVARRLRSIPNASGVAFRVLRMECGVATDKLYSGPAWRHVGIPEINSKPDKRGAYVDPAAYAWSCRAGCTCLACVKKKRDGDMYSGERKKNSLNWIDRKYDARRLRKSGRSRSRRNSTSMYLFVWFFEKFLGFFFEQSLI